MYGSQRQYDTAGVFSPLEALCNNDDDYCLGGFDSVERIVNQKIKGMCATMFNCTAMTNQYYRKLRSVLSTSPIVDDRTKASIINVIREYMKFYFVYDPLPSTFMFTTNIEQIGPTPIPMNIYTTTIALKEGTQQAFRLYYATYVREEVPYKIILNIIPTNTSVNSYGLYNTYISAGIYAFKPFNQTGDRYSFIGNILTNMWPLPHLSEGPAAAIPVAASSVPVASSVLTRRKRSSSTTGLLQGGRRRRRKSRRVNRMRR